MGQTVGLDVMPSDLGCRICDMLGGKEWVGKRSRCSDSLRAGRSGDRILVVAWLFPPVQTGLGAYPTSGVKRPGHVFDHLPHLVPRLKKDWSYTFTPLLGLRGPLLGKAF